MKAFLLSAGYGTRLKPLTNNIPKCLVPICGKPLLAWWMDLFEKHGINEVLINTHYLADEVRKFIEYYNAQKTGVTLIESYEKDLLGSGGTVAINKSFIKNEEKFLICYADNLTNIDLSELIKFHTKKQGMLTMGLFYTNNPKECGIAAIDSYDLIYEFIEKPKRPRSHLANAGIYVTNLDIFKYLPQKKFIDFGKNLEIILVDDGSKDESGDICEDYSLKDSRIIVIHKPNGGLSDARNAGIKQAKGEYITFVDSDDTIDYDMIEFLYDLILKFNTKMSICCQTEIFENTNKKNVIGNNEKLKLMIVVLLHLFYGFVTIIL